MRFDIDCQSFTRPECLHRQQFCREFLLLLPIRNSVNRFHFHILHSSFASYYSSVGWLSFVVVCDTWHIHVYSYIAWETGASIEIFCNCKEQAMWNVRTTDSHCLALLPYSTTVLESREKTTVVYVVGSNVAWKLLHLTSSISVNHVFHHSLFLCSFFLHFPPFLVARTVYLHYINVYVLPYSHHFISIQFANSYSLFFVILPYYLFVCIRMLAFLAALTVFEFHILTSLHPLISLPHSPTASTLLLPPTSPIHARSLQINIAIQIEMVRSNRRFFIHSLRLLFDLACLLLHFPSLNCRELLAKFSIYMPYRMFQSRSEIKKRMAHSLSQFASNTLQSTQNSKRWP